MRDGVAVFTLDNPPQNRLTVDVLLAFVAGLEQAKADESVRVVVVQARGENFSYGGDITPWPQLAPEDMGQLVAQGLAHPLGTGDPPCARDRRCAGRLFRRRLRDRVTR